MGSSGCCRSRRRRRGRAAPRLRQAERRQVSCGRSAWRTCCRRIIGRLVWAFAERLDLSPLYGAIKAVEGRPGHPPADPRLLLALWLYATVEGVGSARELDRLCREHIGFEWLCGGVGMNHTTLADFRVAHGAVLERLLVDSFAAMLAAGVPRSTGWRRTACGCGRRRRRLVPPPVLARALPRRGGGRGRPAAREIEADPGAADGAARRQARGGGPRASRRGGAGRGRDAGGRPGRSGGKRGRGRPTTAAARPAAAPADARRRQAGAERPSRGSRPRMPRRG